MSSESSPENDSVPCRALTPLGTGAQPTDMGMSPSAPGERPQVPSRVWESKRLCMAISKNTAA